MGFASLQDGWGHRSVLARGGKQGRLCRGRAHPIQAPALSPGIWSGPCSAGHRVPCSWAVRSLGSLTWEYCTGLILTQSLSRKPTRTGFPILLPGLSSIFTPVSLLSKEFSILARTQRAILEQLRRFAKNRAWNMLLPHTRGCLSVLPHANKNTSFFCFLLITAGDLNWRRKHLIY